MRLAIDAAAKVCAIERSASGDTERIIACPTRGRTDPGRWRLARIHAHVFHFQAHIFLSKGRLCRK